MAHTRWLDTFGARPAGARLARIARSPHSRDGVFENPIPTHKTLPGTFWQTMRMQFTGGEQREPPEQLPIVPLSRASFATPPASALRATWLGHATTLLEIDGVRLLLDPVWAERASPSSRLGPRRFHRPPLALDALPPLDAVVISHDHYDHLDMDAVRALASDPTQAAARFVVPLGVGAHLEHWGVAPARITELDWGESTDVGALTLTATPARHVSGRGVGDTFGRGNWTLWASWVIAGPAQRVFFSGDSGPFDGFADVGARYGPFDLTLVKIGAYGPTWPEIHLTPEQAVSVHAMLRGRVLLPIHWGTFNLAFHAWDEPAERVVVAAEAARVTLVMPRPGESIDPAAPPRVRPWWRGVTAPR